METPSKLWCFIHLVIPVASTFTSCPQHLRIYRGGLLTSTRGLWTPVKCYLVHSSKWSDHKQSNRGINGQYWPVFLLRPAPMASSQDPEDGARTFASLEGGNWAKRCLFYNSPEILDSFHLLLVQVLLDLCLDHSIKPERFWDVFVWSKDLTRSETVYIPCGRCHVCEDTVCDRHAALKECLLSTEVNMDIDGQSWPTCWVLWL